MAKTSEDKNNLPTLIGKLRNEVTGKNITIAGDVLYIDFYKHNIHIGKKGGDYDLTIHEGNAMILRISKDKFQDYQIPLADLYSHCMDLAEKYPLNETNKKAGEILEEWEKAKDS